MQSSSFNIEIYCKIVLVVKYREIFQVYNNRFNVRYKKSITPDSTKTLKSQSLYYETEDWHWNELF